MLLRSIAAPLAITAMLQGLSGCGGGGDDGTSSATGQAQSQTEASDPGAQLEAAHGGAFALHEFFATHTEPEIHAELARFGIRYEVRTPIRSRTTLDATSHIESAKPQNISDCVKLFPSSDRQIWVNFDGEYYYVDGSGRPNKAYKDLPPITAEARQDSCQTSIGQWGDAEDPSNDYDGGHLIGSQLGGWGGRANIVPQDANFNRGNWAQLENKMAKCSSLPAGRIRYSITVGYANSTNLVPGTFAMALTNRSTGSGVTLNFTNVDYGGANGTSERTRGTTFLTNNGCG
jgi:hypothetical protein